MNEKLIALAEALAKKRGYEGEEKEIFVEGFLARVLMEKTLQTK